MIEMISFHARMLFFVASFSPMWFVLIGSYLINDHSPMAIIISFSIIIGIIGTIIYSCNLFAKYRESTNMDPVCIEHVKDITYKHTTHLIAYVFFVLIDVTLQHNMFVLISLAVFLCIVFSRTNMVLTSPALFAIGFKMYAAKVNLPTREITLLSTYNIKNDDQIYIKEIAPNIFVDKLKYQSM